MSMIFWEYIDIQMMKMTGFRMDELNSVGSEGWELILYIDGKGIFKRPYKLCSDCNTKVLVTVSNCSNCGAPVG